MMNEVQKEVANIQREIHNNLMVEDKELVSGAVFVCVSVMCLVLSFLQHLLSVTGFSSLQFFFFLATCHL